MRLVFALLLAAAGPLTAEPLLIAPDRILGVFAAEEYANNEWNRDDYSDLSVMAISQAGDAVDLYMATSDSETGDLRVTEIAYGILPYDPARTADIRYTIFPSHETYHPVIGYSSSVSQKALYMRIGARDTGSDIMNISTSTPGADGRTLDRVCDIWFINIFEDDFVPHATVLSPDGVKVTYNPGPAPVLTQWHYTDLPKPCLP